MFQKIQRMLIDDDQDCLIIEVLLTAPTSGGKEASCHVGYRSCFYREIPLSENPASDLKLKFLEDSKSFDPEKVYEGIANPTQL